MEQQREKINNFEIRESENLFLDGVPIKNVSRYELKHEAGDIAELTITLSVNVNKQREKK